MATGSLMAPYIFVATALGALMIVELRLAVMQQSWLLAKIAGILVYILLGFVVMRLGKTQQARMLAYVAAIAVFAYVGGTAVAKSPASWLAYLMY